MTCPHCTAAESNVRHPAYDANCTDCKARAMAYSPVAHKRITRPCDEYLSAYRKAMRITFGEQQAQAQHERVMHWYKRLEKK